RALAAGDNIGTVPPVDITKLVEQAGEVMDRAKKVADRAAYAIDAFAAPKTVNDVQASLSSMRALLRAVEHGPGFVHALFYDPEQARAVSALVQHVDDLTRHVDGGVRSVDAILSATDRDGRQLVN